MQKVLSVLDFAHSRNKAFEQVSLINTVSILSVSEKKHLGFLKFVEVWGIKTEIFLPNDLAKEINLHICFPEDFPLVLPKIYLAPQDHEWIKFIPHVDVKGYVCTFDEESITLDTSQPGGIVQNSLYKAVKIIEDGLAKRNIADFTDEFIAYWTESYSKSDSVNTGINMLDFNFVPTSNTVELLKLNTTYSGYTFILHNGSFEFLQLKSFLIEKGITYDEVNAFYLGELNSLQPPFDLTYQGVYDLIQQKFSLLLPSFKKFINQSAYPKNILFSLVIKNQLLFFGWRILKLETIRKGYRPQQLSAIDVLNTFQKNDFVERIKFDQYTKSRLQLRTDGHLIETSLNFTIAGLGSVGSNFLNLLTPLNIRNLVLIDPDILTIENIERHLLGMNFIGKFKVDGIKDFFKSNNPLLGVKTIRKSIVRIMETNIKTFNESDYIIVSIGNNNIEEYIFNALKENVLKIPVFILWVEPYLCGAHCLLIQPNHKLKINELYTDGLFNYNIIEESEYKKPSRQLNFREAGCQSSFLPYGQKNLTLFLAALISEIYKIIQTKDQRNLHIAWKGNEKQQNELNLKLSKQGQKMEFDSLEINEL